VVAVARWHNWAGNAESRPTRILTPRSVDEVVSAVQAAAARELPVRMVGAGHSCSPAAVTSGVMLTSDGMVGVEQVSDTEVRVLPGTTVDQLCRELDSLGLALPAVGDIRAETVAGAALTAQHGSGRQTPSLTAGIQALELVLADGDVVTVAAAQDGDLFQAAKAGLGGFGVVTSLTLATVPTYLLHARTFPDRFENTVSTFDDWDSDHDMVEFDWYPHTDRTVVRQFDRSAGPVAHVGRSRRWPSGPIRSFATAGGVARLGRSLPPAVPGLNRLSAAAQPPGDTTDRWWRVLPTAPKVRFVELEYALPRPMLRPALTMVRRAIEDGPERVTLPVLVRTGPAEDAWLAPAEGRATVYICLRVFHRSPYQRYFDTAEAVLTELEARPRLGTAQSLGAERLASRYPRFADVQRVRNRVDPDRRFGNDYLARVLGDGA
jgi:FAD-linked oxidoreductase